MAGKAASSHKGVPAAQKEKQKAHTVFSQQRILAWRPLFTPKFTVIISYVLASVLIIIGSLLYVYLNELPMIDIRYDDVCEGQAVCGVNFTIDKAIKGDIYLHYKLTKFYQNHRRYLFSRNYKQLRGEYVSYEDLGDCAPFRSKDDSEDPNALYLPSGVIARSFFNDTYEWVEKEVANFSEAGISWRSDRDKLYKRLSPEYTKGIRWLKNFTDFPDGQRNEHFIVWMRTAILPTFLKTYARCINCEIPAGNYKIRINNSYPTSLFGGEKHIVLSKVTVFGGRNPYIGMTYIVVGVIIALFGTVVLISHLFFPRKLGDTSFLRKL
jgi:hypothetical protein